MRKYDEEFKMNALKLYKSSKKPLKDIASELGIPFGTMRTWSRRDALSNSVSLSGSDHRDSEAQLRLLKKELHHVRQERDILKKAVAIFSEPRGKGIAS